MGPICTGNTTKVKTHNCAGPDAGSLKYVEAGLPKGQGAPRRQNVKPASASLDLKLDLEAGVCPLQSNSGVRSTCPTATEMKMHCTSELRPSAWHTVRIPSPHPLSPQEAHKNVQHLLWKPTSSPKTQASARPQLRLRGEASALKHLAGACGGKAGHVRVLGDSPEPGRALEAEDPKTSWGPADAPRAKTHKCARPEAGC